MRRRLYVLLFTFILTGCVSVWGSGKRVVLPVPFNPQEDYYCGPSSLASVMQFYGKQINQHEIAREVYRKDLSGSIALDLMLYARKMGFRAELIEGSIGLIENSIDNGKPVIVLLDIGWFFYSRPHFAVVVGYDRGNDRVIINSGRSREKEYDRDEFIKMWKAMGSLILLVEPSDNK